MSRLEHVLQVGAAIQKLAPDPTKRPWFPDSDDDMRWLSDDDKRWLELESDSNTQKHCRRSTISRKLLEIPFALALEYAYSKEDILSIYINRVYLGSGAYGFEAASERYFNKNSSSALLWQSELIIKNRDDNFIIGSKI